jgi:hypothetical protein
LTDKQLESFFNLKKFDINYYPESKLNKIPKYFDWKVKEIKEVIKDLPKENLMIHIFDEMNEYFPKLRNFLDESGIQLNLTLIKDENSWD